MPAKVFTFCSDSSQLDRRGPRSNSLKDLRPPGTASPHAAIHRLDMWTPVAEYDRGPRTWLDFEPQQKVERHSKAPNQHGADRIAVAHHCHLVLWKSPSNRLDC